MEEGKSNKYFIEENEEGKKQPQITPISTFIWMTEFSIKCIKIQTNNTTRRSSSLHLTSTEQLHKQNYSKV